MGDSNIDNPVQDVPKTAKERILGTLGGVVHASTGQGPATESPLFKKMNEDHQKRLDLARHHQKQWATARQVIITGKNPQTGEHLTAEEAERWKNIMDAEQTEYEKAAGTSKETKEIVKKHIGLVDHIGNIFKKRQQEQQGLPGPPKADAGDVTGSATGSIDQSVNAGSDEALSQIKPGQLPPPPSASPPSAMERTADIGQASQFQAREQAKQDYQSKVDIDTQAKIKEQAAKAEMTPTVKEDAWAQQFYKENERWPTTTERDNHYRNIREKPIDAQLQKSIDLANQAQAETDPAKKEQLQQQAKEAFAVATQAAGAKKGPQSTAGLNTLIGQITRSLDPNATPEQRQLAEAAIRKYTQQQYNIRAAGYIERSKRQFGTFEVGSGPDAGKVNTMSMDNAKKMQDAGVQLTYIGQPSFSTVTGLQKFVKEAPAAMKGFNQDVKNEQGKSIGKTPLDAFDNASDRAIFARIFSEVGNGNANDVGYVGKLINQMLLHKDELSPEGRALVISENRMMDTIFTAQNALGAQKTNEATEIFRNMLPGPVTPDSKFAKLQVQALEANLKNTLTEAVSGLVETPEEWQDKKPSGKLAAPPKGSKPLSPAAKKYLDDNHIPY